MRDCRGSSEVMNTMGSGLEREGGKESKKGC